MTDYNRVLARIDALSDVPVKCVFLGVQAAYASTNDSSEEPKVVDCWDDNLTRSCLAYANKLFKSILLELEFICVRKYDEIQDSDDKVQGSGDNLFVCVCGRPPAKQLLEILESIHVDPIQVFSPALPKSEPLPDVRCTYRVKPATQSSDAGRGSEDGGRGRGSSKTQEDASSGAQTTRLDNSGQPTKETAKKWHLCSDGLLHESFGEVPEIEADRSDGLPFPRWYFEVVVDDLEDAIVEAIYRKVKESKFPGSDKIVKRIEAKKRSQISGTGKGVGRPTHPEYNEALIHRKAWEEERNSKGKKFDLEDWLDKLDGVDMVVHKHYLDLTSKEREKRRNRRKSPDKL